MIEEDLLHSPGEVRGIAPAELPQYDYRILATGAQHSYFGHDDEFEPFAPGLRPLADAGATRNRILQAFEQAKAEEDPSCHRDLLTFVLVGEAPVGQRWLDDPMRRIRGDRT